MKILYLASGYGILKYQNVTYQDKIVSRDLSGDMLQIDLTPYDLIVATPPCNFWSKARGNRISQYSLDTMHLLPSIIEKCVKINKPFIIENVINRKRMKEIIEQNQHIYHECGRHSYFTNIKIDLKHIKQSFDFSYGGVLLVPKIEQQGGSNVRQVLEYIIDEYIKYKGGY